MRLWICGRLRHGIRYKFEDAKIQLDRFVFGAVIGGRIGWSCKNYDIRKGGMTSDKLNGKKINKHF